MDRSGALRFLSPNPMMPKPRNFIGMPGTNRHDEPNRSERGMPPSEPTNALIPHDPNVPQPLGRHQHHDPRNRLFRALDQPVVEVPARTSPWPTDWVGNQNQTPGGKPDIPQLAQWPLGTCTAYAWVGLCRTAPHRTTWSAKNWRHYDTAFERIMLYLEGQEKADPWPGSEITDPRYEGSSTDAPARIMRDRGHIPGWRWLFGVDEVKYHLQHRGPVAVGTVWLGGMFTPNDRGFLTVKGDQVGGHAYRIVFYDPKRRAFLKVGSWGLSWANRGRAWIDEEDFGWLLSQGGEAVTMAGV